LFEMNNIIGMLTDIEKIPMHFSSKSFLCFVLQQHFFKLDEGSRSDTQNFMWLLWEGEFNFKQLSSHSL